MSVHSLRPSLGLGIGQAQERLAQAGTWLDARTATLLIDSTRSSDRCQACTAAETALSPEHVGDHNGPDGLSQSFVDLTHRVRRDNSRLAESWVKATIKKVGEGEYVEAVGIGGVVAILDTFSEAVGVGPFGFDTSHERVPERVEPDGLAIRYCWVRTIAPEAATGEIRALYGDEDVATVDEALTLSPYVTSTFWGLVKSMYIKPGTEHELSDLSGDLTLAEVELLASRLSVLNECFY